MSNENRAGAQPGRDLAESQIGGSASARGKASAAASGRSSALRSIKTVDSAENYLCRAAERPGGGKRFQAHSLKEEGIMARLRRAMTLVELLGVIAIIGMIV